MLTIYSAGSDTPLVWNADSTVPASPVWLDLVDPTETERNQAVALLGTYLPTRDQTSAIELSSRLRSSEEALRLNVPSFVRADGDNGPLTPLGFVLTPKLLATVRYAEAQSFQQVADALGNNCTSRGSVELCTDLLESIVDVGADHIEDLAASLSKLSRAVFVNRPSHHRLLRSALFEVGERQMQITQLRSAMLGLLRLVTYLCENAPSWVDKSLHVRFRTIQADIESLNEFDEQLTERLQFLLDAVLGFINNDQNDIMRVLTIVSVATVPPMILAGIWGMNFKSIPEYDWAHGYAFGLSMIVLSMLIPVIWFKLKKWI